MPNRSRELQWWDLWNYQCLIHLVSISKTNEAESLGNLSLKPKWMTGFFIGLGKGTFICCWEVLSKLPYSCPFSSPRQNGRALGFVLLSGLSVQGSCREWAKLSILIAFLIIIHCLIIKTLTFDISAVSKTYLRFQKNCKICINFFTLILFVK